MGSGFTVSLATVSLYMPKRPRDRGKQQRWMTFLQNHKDGGIGSVYDRHSYADENRHIQEAVAARIMDLLAVR